MVINQLLSAPSLFLSKIIRGKNQRLGKEQQ